MEVLSRLKKKMENKFPSTLEFLQIQQSSDKNIYGTTFKTKAVMQLTVDTVLPCSVGREYFVTNISQWRCLKRLHMQHINKIWALQSQELV